MNNCEQNQYQCEKRRPKTPSHLQAWGHRMALLATLISGGMIMEGCATAPGTRPDSMSADENNPEASLLRQFGTAEEGKQPDGSYIKISTSKKKSSAIKKAKKFIRIRLRTEKEDDISFDTKISPSPLAGGKWMVVVKGKKLPPEMTPETRKLWIKYNQRVIHHLMKKFQEYKKKYGSRKEFPVFEAEVQKRIARIKEEVKNLQDGKIKRGIFTIIGTIDGVASTAAEMSISMADSKARLLSISEKMDESFRELDRSMRR